MSELHFTIEQPAVEMQLKAPIVREVEICNDYNELENLPSINGHTLIGNQSAAELELASINDIPTEPSDIGAVAENQGTENVGKWLKVSDDGSVIAADLPFNIIIG